MDEPEQAAALAHVIDLERRLLDPTVRADRAQLERLLHPDFEEIGASGRVFDRTSVVAELLTADRDAPLSEMFEIDADMISDDVVLVRYSTRRGSESAGRSSWWVRDDGEGWRVRFHQGTPTP